MTEGAEMLLERCVRTETRDWTLWVEYAKIQYRRGKAVPSQQSFLQAYRIDKDAVYARLLKDEELQKLAMPLFQRRK